MSFWVKPGKNRMKIYASPGNLHWKWRSQEMIEIVYPVNRLFANPRIFFAIANYLGGPEGELLKNYFYELMEYGFEEYENPEEAHFDATEICFRMNEEDGTVEMILDSGLASILKPVEGEIHSQITNDQEMAATSAIYQRLVSAIEETNPDFVGNIALCNPPTPANRYLRSSDGERFEGAFHLLTDPERQYSFNVDIIDVNQDILKATYKPI